MANKAVITLLADKLDIPKSKISIISGPKDRLKSVLIKGDGETNERIVKQLFEPRAPAE